MKMTGPLSQTERMLPVPVAISDHVSQLSKQAHRDRFSGS
jgi:hypothetical protein